MSQTRSIPKVRSMSATSPGSTRFRTKITELFGADLRSLAAYRIVLGLLALGDLWTRATNLTAHYADVGVLPRTALLEHMPNRWTFSVHMATGETLVLAVLLFIQGVAALALLVGLHTRLAVFVVWFLTISLDVRNPLVLSDADVLLRMLLFWALFLPLGAYWSVDRSRSGAAQTSAAQFLSFATVGLFAQIVFVYLFTVLLKSGPEWRVDGTALYYALTLRQFVTPFGEFVHQFSDLLRLMTVAVFWFEALGPLLLFSPVLTGPLRTFGVLAFMGLHVGIRLSMSIGLFPWVAALCMVCFLPAWFWDKIPGLARIPPRDRWNVHRWSWGSVACLAPIIRSPSSGPVRSFAGQGAGAERPSARQMGLSLRSRAEGETGRVSPLGARSDPGTEAPAGTATSHPSNLGSSRDQVPSPPTLRSSRLVNLLAALFLALVFWWNLTTVTGLQVPEPLTAVVSLLRLNQRWSMFAPSPGRTSHYYVIPGELVDGTSVELSATLRGDLSIFTPANEPSRPTKSESFKDHRWEKYLSQIGRDRNSELRLYLGRYICREWNSSYDGAKRVRRFQIYSVSETALPDYREPEPVRRLLWRHKCF